MGSAVISDTPFVVFGFLNQIYDCFPGPLKYLLYITFGGVVTIAVLRGLGR